MGELEENKGKMEESQENLGKSWEIYGKLRESGKKTGNGYCQVTLSSYIFMYWTPSDVNGGEGG